MGLILNGRTKEKNEKDARTRHRDNHQSAVVVAVFLGAPHVKAQLKAHSRSKKGDSGHAKNE